MAPAYINDLINVRKLARFSLHSLNSGTLLLHPAGKMKRFFSRSFSVSAPTPWNVLPACLCNITGSSIFIFKSRLKTYLLKLAFSL